MTMEDNEFEQQFTDGKEVDQTGAEAKSLKERRAASTAEATQEFTAAFSADESKDEK
jgi:hypothetical protein